MTFDWSIFFDAYAGGCGAVEAAHRAGATYEAFRQELRRDHTLRARWAEAKLDKKEQAERVVWAAVQGGEVGPSYGAAIDWLKLYQQDAELRVKARAKQNLHDDGKGRPEPKLYRLTDDEWDLYNSLCDRMQAGEELAGRDAAAYSRLMGIAIRSDAGEDY